MTGLVPALLQSVDAETRNKRRSVCEGCEFKQRSPWIGIEVCGACGCPLNTKISLQRSTCPKGKW